jgi:hypothetical protein
MMPMRYTGHTREVGFEISIFKMASERRHEGEACAETGSELTHNAPDEAGVYRIYASGDCDTGLIE